MPSPGKSTLSACVRSTRGMAERMSAVHYDYVAPPLESVDPDWLAQFNTWFGDAQAAGLVEPEAMVLSTAAARARYVLLRGVDYDGFRFYTNHESAKAEEL